MPAQYRPVRGKRHFTANTYYSDIDWNDESAAIQKFKEQLEGWYIRPIESLIATSPHYGFTVIALTCVLIDTLSQYYFGKESSSQTLFKNFLTDHFPHFGNKFPTPILDNSNPKKPQPVENYADAVYRAFRCGILHEAHVLLYAVVHDDAPVVQYFEKADITRYVNGNECPTVVISPTKFFEEIKTVVFEDYFQKLLTSDPQWDDLRTKFKTKFLVSYGIDIGKEP